MDILGIGPTELAFIILIALILLGPKEMQKTGRTIGRFLRDMTQSEGWRAFRDTSREIRNLPNRLMREANIEDLDKEVGKIGKELEDPENVKGYGTWANPPQSRPKPAEAPKKQPPAETTPIKEANEEPEDDA
jgi:Sec-independent protein translocase protein TatA